jgi:adenylosuccinate lyase
MAGDPEIGMSREEIEKVLDLREFVGRAPEQVTEFVADYIQPMLDRHADMLDSRSDVRV